MHEGEPIIGVARQIAAVCIGTVIKIAIGVTYDSDLTLAKKLIKQIGLDLARR
jgi:hypothetical protein